MTIGQLGSGAYHAGFTDLGLNRKYSATVTGFAPRANVRAIRRGCWSSLLSSLPTSVVGDPIRNSTGPGSTTIVCPCPLTYHCGGACTFSFAVDWRIDSSRPV